MYDDSSTEQSFKFCTIIDKKMNAQAKKQLDLHIVPAVYFF